MRKISFLIVAFSLICSSAFAQDAAKWIKDGSRALAEYKDNPKDMDALKQAQEAAKKVTMSNPEISGGWLLLANSQAAEVIQSAATINDLNAQHAAAVIANPESKAPDFTGMDIPSGAGLKAIDAYKKAYSSAVKNKGKKKAIAGMKSLGSTISVLGNAMLSSSQYKKAYEPLKAMLDIDQFFKDSGEEPLFNSKENLDQQRYITAVVAREAGDRENAMLLHEQLVAEEIKEPVIYAGYSSMLFEDGNTAKGEMVLNKGREMFPENKDMLFAEINYYIQKGDYNTLESKLQEAISKEPDNVGLYNALGNVYMNLSQDSTIDASASKSYEEQSIKYYKDVLNLDPNNVDANYSIGSMYYNSAVRIAGQMDNLTTSKADQKKYDEYKSKLTGLFDQALPYFEKAISIDGNDRNTLIALKEIYARKGDYAKSKEYGSRIK